MDKDRIVSSAKDMAGKVEGAVGNITGDTSTHVSGVAREASGTAQNIYGQAKDSARDAADTAATYAKDAYDTSGAALREGSQMMAESVHDNPIASLLVAGGIGFALGLMMAGTSRREW